MRSLARKPRCLASLCGLLLAAGITQAQTAATAATRPTSPSLVPGPTHSLSPISKKHLVSGKRRRVASKRNRGQQKIDPARAREIQEALIREHYLGGEATGKWDDASQKAMERFQADNGWQSTVVPDSRALIKLGLGPDHEHLLNPETAMTSIRLPEPPAPAPVAASPVPAASAIMAVPGSDDPPRSDHK